MDDTSAAAYLAAFIDGEGHVGCHITGRGEIGRVVSFSNTDHQLFDRVVALARQIGVRFHTYHRKAGRQSWSEQWAAYLKRSQPSFEMFKAVVPLQCERKIAALNEIIESYRGPQALESLYASRRTSVIVHCATCGNAFSVFPADIKRGQGIYCSTACWGRARRHQVTKTCLTCGKEYTVPPSRESKSKYCSPRCFGLSQAPRIALQAKNAAEARWHSK